MKLRIKFSKHGCMKFIGHLDVMRYFQKAIRRAGIDIAYSEGFSPHQIMSFAAPLGVGLESDGEYLDIQVNAAESSEVMVRKLNQVMVEGMQVKSVRLLRENSKNAMSIVAAADYLLRFGQGFPEGFSRFLDRKEIPVSKKTKKRETVMDIRPLIYEYRIESEGVFLKLAAGSVDNLKPELVMDAFFRDRGLEWNSSSCQICRLELYARTKEGELATLESLGDVME